MEHYPVQLIGGIVLHQGRIAEMKTGEGKTLVSTCPAYLNALSGKGVQIVTVNDYLAKRDAEWMGQVHEFLGLKVGVVLNSMTSEERKAAYQCDITYVTNNELGFDYLRDNMAIYKDQMVLRDLDYCIIDEVDSVLIDEARTPLIISGQSGKSTKLYEVCDVLAKQLVRGEESGEFNKLNAICIHRSVAKSKGIHVRLLDNLFAVLVALIVMLSIKWIGILIINALLILPAASSRNISENMREYHFFSVLFSVFSGIVGLAVSYYTNVATGPMIVIIASVIYFSTFIFGRKLKK